MQDDDELVWSTAIDLRNRIAAGEVSAVEVTEAHLRRIEAVNPGLNAVVTLTADRALDDARAADAAHARGDDLGLLHGVPTAHKDLADTAGVRTTYGSPVFADRVPDADDLVVARAKAAGAISLGKTNTPEFGAGSQTFNPVFGATSNPFDTTRTCGGSSGGAAVALAAGMVPIADGSDLGGSLRNPASFCNVVGFRPTPGRVPSWSTSQPWNLLSTSGPMARNVDDVALLLAAQTGPDPRVPVSLDTHGMAFAPPIDPTSVALRVAWAPDLGGLPIAAEVSHALATVPQVLSDLGHRVDEAAPELTGAFEVFDTLRAWFYAMSSAELLDQHRDQLKETLRWNIERGLNLEMADHQRAWRLRAVINANVADFFAKYDVLFCPTAQVAPFPLDQEYVTEINGTPMSTYIEWMRVCTDVTVMHCPAISVPAAFTEGGLPVGVQIVGPPRSDAFVLSVAKQFEQATRVGDRRPTL